MIASRVAAALAVAGWLLAPAPAAANEAIRDAGKKLAGDIKNVLDEEKRTDLAIGDFSGMPALDAQFGPGIKALLSEELGKTLTITKRAELAVKGDYNTSSLKDSGRNTVEIVITARVLTRDGRELVRLKAQGRLAKFEVKVKDETAIAKIAGVTAALPVTTNKAVRNEAVNRAIDDPKVFITGGRVRATPASKFGVELLVRPAPGADPVARPAAVKDGQAFVELRKGEEFLIKLYNDTAFEAAAAATVDGVDVFHFSTDRDGTGKKPGHYLVDQNGTVVIPGWHLSGAGNGSAAAFEVVDSGKGVAAELGVTTGTGVVTVTFSASGQPDDLPKDEPESVAQSAANRSVAVGKGRLVEGRTQQVPRTIGVVREVISIRYTR